MKNQSFYQFHSDGITFTSSQLTSIKTIYAPLCGSDALGLKSAITPSLAGDIKLDKYHYLTKPTSREDLRYPGREFFVSVKGNGFVGLFQETLANSSQVTVGPLWHQLVRKHSKIGLELTAINLIPSSNETIELMKVSVKNISRKPLTITATSAIPLFGRSLANKHDHEQVTSLLNRIEQVNEGIVVRPTMAFNEEGHKEIDTVYFVFAQQDKAINPVGSFPTVESFIGETGNMLSPEAIINEQKPSKLKDDLLQGKEAIGALQFKQITLKPNQSIDYIVGFGIARSSNEAKAIFNKFNNVESFNKSLKATQEFWKAKISSIVVKVEDNQFNSWMSWVTIQPILRRIFGCSFLPDHDYGKGGKGWRDIWQDLLSLILIEPQMVRENLLNNCAGIRIDGSNATIIGSKLGEFIADRNAITRVWMDHGAWPLLTILLYVDQTGDYQLLLEKQSYFKDPQLSRTKEKDLGWISQSGNKLLDKKGQVHHGSILEHLLVENLVQFFNVGEHNIIRLESADWNDGLDMAFDRGESVAFMSFYGSNLLKLADVIEQIGRLKNQKTISLSKELLILLDSMTNNKVDYDNAKAKRDYLFGKYFSSVQPVISGAVVDLDIHQVANDLRHKAHWIVGQIRRQEKLVVEHQGKKYQWFNGYYDNKGSRVEGFVQGKIRMTLTGQVFSVMSGMAQDQEVQEVIKSVDTFLRDKKLGGYRLNTDFGLRHYLDLGRAFGFAFGTKENGAFFSHMIVMYAYALYSRGFAREGYEVIQSIYQMAKDTQKSRIYPGIPEYFDSNGQGMYHYLTGSASWLVLTQLTQTFGVRGQLGDLILNPQLVKEEFDQKGIASISCQFAGAHLKVEYRNPQRIEAGAYSIVDATINGKSFEYQLLGKSTMKISRSLISSLKEIHLIIELGAKKLNVS